MLSSGNYKNARFTPRMDGIFRRIRKYCELSRYYWGFRRIFFQSDGLRNLKVGIRNLRFCSLWIRSASKNDKSVVNRSQFVKNTHPTPPAHYFVADEGYVLSNLISICLSIKLHTSYYLISRLRKAFCLVDLTLRRHSFFYFLFLCSV